MLYNIFVLYSFYSIFTNFIIKLFLIRQYVYMYINMEMEYP